MNVPDSLIKFGLWHVVFEADCNLRCAYCSTDHGTLGYARRRMHQDVWKPLVTFALSLAPSGRSIRFEFGCGETFIHFNEFIKMVDYLHLHARRRNVPVEITVSTNGTLLDLGRLRQLSDRDISLAFSIDGPAEIHDRFRTTANGMGSHKSALNNWKMYRKMLRGCQQAPGCNVQSVYTASISLADVVEFWNQNDQPIFNCMIQLPGKSRAQSSFDAWRKRQNAYLADLEKHALRQAKQLNIPSFLTDYRGPDDLYMAWQRLLMGRELESCAAGEDIIAVDTKGKLYPCEAYFGVASRCIGDIFQGISKCALDNFQHERSEAVKICEDCSERPVCPKSCVAAFPEQGLAFSFRDGCRFARKVSEIARRSYQLLSMS